MHSLQRVRRTSRLERRGLNKTTKLSKIVKFKDDMQAKALKSMEKMISNLNDKWDRYDDKINKIDERFDTINKNINEIDNQITEVKSSLVKPSTSKRILSWIKKKVLRIK